MTHYLPQNAHQIFEREQFTFKQLKENRTSEEIEQIKLQYKEFWQAWKELQLAVFEELSADFSFEKPKIESWTNGWNLRNHFWSAYRLTDEPNSNACLAVLLNRKQLQVYLMYQHYKSDLRVGDAQTYNQVLSQLAEWSKTVNLTDYYIWPQQENELENHLLLTDYLADNQKQVELAKSIEQTSFQIGKLYYTSEILNDEKTFILEGFKEMMPLFQRIIKQT